MASLASLASPADSAPVTPVDSEDEASTSTPQPASTSSVPANPSTTKKATSVDCFSMQLDGFILNQHIFNKEHYIAPLSRPDNSSFLPGVFSAHDAIPHVDIDGAYPWHRNSRIADITKTPDSDGKFDHLLRAERLGVYLHWCLPKKFRSGATSANGDDNAGDVEHTHVPDRWIIFRFIGEASEPNPPALTTFIVESNRIRHFGGLDDPSVGESFDVEVEASPFIDRNLPVEKQIDVFMGMKRKFDNDWVDPDPQGQYHVPLTLLDSANPLFADFQHHNSNVFSVHDDMTWTSTDGKTQVHPSSATVSYAVFGYYSQATESKTICHGSLFNVHWARDKAPEIAKAIQIAKDIGEKQPIALGTDTLEALETYLHSIKGKDDWVALINEMKTAIYQAGHGGLFDTHIPQNLRAGFKPADGGRCWRFNNESLDADTGHAHIPSPEEMKTLFSLDRRQAYTDALDRQERYVRHRLFCEWWKRRSRVPGGKWTDPICQNESRKRVEEGLKALDTIKQLRSTYTQDNVPAPDGMHLTAKPEFFSRAAPSIVIGGLGATWPSEFTSNDPFQARSLESLPFQGAKGKSLVKNWLADLIGPDKSETCTMHGMKLFFQNPDFVKKIVPEIRERNKNLLRLPGLFEGLDNLEGLFWSAPGWVQVAVDTLMQEWVYSMTLENPEQQQPSPAPAYYTKDDTHWNNTQPCRALFIEWELEYYHLPKRFWTLDRNEDGTADYRIAPEINISNYDLMDHHKRTINGRSILRPNAEWAITTLVQQLFDKLDKDSMEDTHNLLNAGGKEGVQTQLRDALKALNLVTGNLDGFTDHLLTLQQGIHVSPHDSEANPPRTDLEKRLLQALLESDDGHDVTPYGEDLFSLDKAEMDFKPVTHGQARFTKFNIVDKFGQVISPLQKPGLRQPRSLYPCLSRSLACQLNESEGGNFANSVELDDEHCSQFFQLGHRINQDARLNAYFAVNSADYESYHKSAQFFRGDRNLKRGQIEHVWRPATEYEDPVWGWLMLDFRSQGIQVYNADGESMGEVLVPDSVYDKAYWQVYYAEGDLSEGSDENTQLQQFIRQMSDTKFLLGLWAMLADACQNIYHDPMSGDTQMLNMVGRPLALVNIGLNVELANPVMQTQSYQDLLKPEELTLDGYKFEALLGDKANLHDGLIGYFAPQSIAATDLVSAKQPDSSCIFTEFGYPGRNIVDSDNQKPDSFTSPQSNRVYLSPLHVDPTTFPEDPAAYDRALHNHPSTVVLGAIIDPYQPVHIATGILPSTTLKLPQWIIDRTLKRLRLLLRGGPVLTRGDLPGIETSPESWLPPLNQITAEAHIPALTDKGEWSWLQPTLSEYATGGSDEEYLPTFVPYNLKAGASDYPLEMGPHTVLEGFYKYGLLEMESNTGKLLAGKPPGDDA